MRSKDSYAHPFSFEEWGCPEGRFRWTPPLTYFWILCDGVWVFGLCFLLVGSVFRSFFCQFFDAQNLAALMREREGFAVYKNKRWSERGNVCSGWVCQKMLGQRDRGLWCREARGEEREVTCPFWIFVAGKDVEGSDPLQTRAFPVEGHVGFFWLRVGVLLDILSVHTPLSL